MSFRLWTIFYVFALAAAAMATFDAWGIIAAGYVLAFWTWVFYAPKKDFTIVHLLCFFALVLLVIALLLPAVASAREASRRNQCANNMKQISMALLTYEKNHGALPPAYVADANGKPMHSWRVLILPLLDYKDLYDQYDFNEPWDGPHNRKLADKIHEVFRCPGGYEDIAASPAETNYFVVTGPQTAFPGDKGRPLSAFRDGTVHTLMLVEASGLGIHWMEPRDMTFDEAVQLMTQPRDGHLVVRDGFLTTTYYESAGRNVVYADGRTEYLPQLAFPTLVQSWLTVAGGETMSDDDGGGRGYYHDDQRIKTVVKWSRVYALSVFVFLAVLPAWWVRHRPKSGQPSEK